MSASFTPPSTKGRTSRLTVAATLLLAVLTIAAFDSTPHGGEVLRARVGQSPTATHVDDDPGDDGSGGAAATAQLTSAPTGAVATVPILVYHYVRVVRDPHDVMGINLSVTPSMFAAQMALLHAEGGHPVTLAALIDAMSTHAPLPPHPVVLTFDDGYDDFATVAEPILAAYGFTATDYVVSGFLNRPGFMSAAQVKQMDAAGMVIGSHTVNHVNLAQAPATIARAEIDAGKATLEALLGHRVLDFAYPYGGFTPAVVQLVQQAGFRDAVTTVGGSVQALSERYLLRRTHMGGVTQTLAFFATAAGLPQAAPGQASAALAAASRQVGAQPLQPAPAPAPRPSSRASSWPPPHRRRA